jgi:glycosyltransferase 2 family protein
MRIPRRSLVILGATGFLLWLFLRKADFSSVVAEMRQAVPGGLLLALAMTVLTYVVRAARWQYLLAPIGRVSFSTAFRTTVIGFAANAVLPGRVGEVLRPYLLARREGLSATATLATILLERVLDIAAVLLLFAAFVLVFDPGLAAVDPATFRAVRVGGLMAGAASLAALGVAFVAAGHPERLGRVAARVSRLLPSDLARRVGHFVEAFARGLAVMRQPRRLVMAVALSIPLWLFIAAGAWFVIRAFHMTLPYTGSFLVITFLAVGVLVPTPGAVGGFHEAFRIALNGFYGAANDRAVAAAVVLHAISIVPVSFAGLFFMAQEGLNLGRLRTIARDVREAPDPTSAPPAARPELEADVTTRPAPRVVVAGEGRRGA